MDYIFAILQKTKIEIWAKFLRFYATYVKFIFVYLLHND